MLDPDPLATVRQVEPAPEHVARVLVARSGVATAAAPVRLSSDGPADAGLCSSLRRAVVALHVAELLRREDVAARFEQPARDGVHDALGVAARQREDELGRVEGARDRRR